MNHTDRLCLHCGVEFTPVNKRQKWCVACKPWARKEYNAQWRVLHPKYWTQWNAAHPERDRSRDSTRDRDPKRKAQRKARYLAHPEEFSGRVRRWRREHPEQTAIFNARHRAKHRTLGFIPLNVPFVDSTAHHIDKEHVIYVPRELHQGIPHNVWTGHNMEKINTLALEWAGLTRSQMS